MLRVNSDHLVPQTSLPRSCNDPQDIQTLNHPVPAQDKRTSRGTYLRPGGTNLWKWTGERKKKKKKQKDTRKAGQTRSGTYVTSDSSVVSEVGGQRRLSFESNRRRGGGGEDRGGIEEMKRKNFRRPSFSPIGETDTAKRILRALPLDRPFSYTSPAPCYRTFKPVAWSLRALAYPHRPKVKHESPDDSRRRVYASWLCSLRPIARSSSRNYGDRFADIFLRRIRSRGFLNLVSQRFTSNNSVSFCTPIAIERIASCIFWLNRSRNVNSVRNTAVFVFHSCQFLFLCFVL